MKILVCLVVAACILSVQVRGQDKKDDAPLGKVSCQPDTMTVVFKKADLEGHEPRIGDEGCGAKITEDNDTVTVVVPLAGCDTETRVDDNRVAYLNKILIVGKSDSVITRMESKMFPFGCLYDTTGTTKTRSFSILKRNVTYYEKEYGKFTFAMDFYKSDKFEDAYEDNAYPVQVQLSKPVFFKAAVGNVGKSLSLFIEECYATPTMDPKHELKYTLIRNGCLVDDTLKEFDLKTVAEKAYSFKSFKFTNPQNTDAIYMHCNLKVCHEDSADSVCKDGCKEKNSGGGRRRRAIKDMGSQAKEVRAGPFMVFEKGQSGYQGKPHNHTPLIIACAAGAVALVALVIIGAIIYTKRQ